MGGIIEPPAKLTSQITEWVQEMYLSGILFILNQNGKDTKELKYGKIKTNTPIDLNQKPRKTFDNLTVLIDPSVPDRAGSRHAKTIEINIPVPTVPTEITPANIHTLMGEIHRVVQHELIHATQDGSFGLPPRKTKTQRDPYGFAVSPKTKERLSKELQSHHLREVEFYPELHSAISKFRRFVVIHSLLFPGKYPLTQAIKIYIGEQKAPEGSKFLSPAPFFIKLRRYNKPRWKKAVKEFIKAIMDDTAIMEIADEDAMEEIDMSDTGAR